MKNDSPDEKNVPDPQADLDKTVLSEQRTLVSGAPTPGTDGWEQSLGETVGNYHILKVLGKGGMGIVYEAEQQNPRRKVALKIIRGRHHADEFHVRMFHREAEMLGRLRHPNIAAIYESGHTDDGRHFFAMELARGETLDHWCRIQNQTAAVDEGSVPGNAETEAPLKPDELKFRLRLFLKICDAVNYAHQRGVIHRDLKPSNIVVFDQAQDAFGGSTEESVATSSTSTLTGQPTVKVLDFGLARIMDPEDDDATMMTQAGSVKGTPAYMSPEQAGGNPDETDLRCDIYSLGVVLYEMLSGVRPLDIENASFVDAIQIIREKEPQSLRRASGRTRRIASDLETVVHKALDKDRERRYQSVAGLAMDIERFLNHEPVLAAPPSATYKLRKLVRRHRSFFASMAAVAVILIGATVVSSTMFVRAERESARARIAAVESEQIASFLTEMLQGVGPSVAMGRDTQMLREILDHTAERIGEELGNQPKVEAKLRAVLGKTYQELGEYEAAEPQLASALEIRRRTRGLNDPSALESQMDVAALSYFLGRMAEAESLYTWTGDRLTEVVGPEDPLTLASQTGLILVYTYQGKLDEGAALGETILPILRQHQGDANILTQTAMFHLAQTYTDQQRYAEAESLYLEVLEIQEREYGLDHLKTLDTKSSLGWLYRSAGRYEEADGLISTVLLEMRRVLGNDHTSTLIAMNNLAIVYKDLERFDEAEPLYIECLETGIRIMGEAHPENLPSMVNMASFYLAQERWNDAYLMADRAAKVFTDVMPEGHVGIAFARMTRGLSLFEQGRLSEAEPDLMAAHEVMFEFFGPGQRHVKNVREKLALICERLDRPEDAALWREAPEIDGD